MPRAHLTVVDGPPAARELAAGDIFRELADLLDDRLPQLRVDDRASAHLHDLARLFRVRAAPSPRPHAFR
jgi:hypothetical protein